MFKEIINGYILILLIAHLNGCTSKYYIPNELLIKNPEQYTISEVQTISSKTFEFKPLRHAISETDIHMHKIIKEYEIVQRGGIIKNDTIIGYLSDGTKKHIPLSQVKKAYIIKGDTFKTIIIFVSALGVLGIIIGIGISQGWKEAFSD